MLYPILENKVVVVRNSASGSPRMKPPRLSAFSSPMKLLDREIRRMLQDIMCIDLQYY